MWMEPFLIGALTAITAVVAMVFWQLLVNPDTVLALLSSDPAEDWGIPHRGAIRALRYALATLLFLLAFVTGATLAVLLASSPR